MKLKTFSTLLKGTAEGTGRVVFATLDVVDKDGDVTIPGAFGNQTAKLVGAHDWSQPSIGLAKVSEDGTDAVADIQFNLQMEAAKNWWQSLKFNFDNGINQEFSYGFDILKESFQERDGRQVRVLEKLKVHEISPVMVGAGVGTRIQTMKSGRTMEQQILELIEVIETAKASTEEVFLRSKALAALRAKEGRTLSRATRNRLSAVLERNQELAAALETLLAETDVPPDDGKTVNLELLEVELKATARCVRCGRLIFGTGTEGCTCLRS